MDLLSCSILSLTIFVNDLYNVEYGNIDDCLLFVAPQRHVNLFKVLEISTLPMWVNLKDIPDSYFSKLGISHINSGLGESMLTHKPRLVDE